MAIKITGMYSGLDTESIINELASAQSYKKNKLVKAQTKLSWKQDAWKALNTKIYKFYSNTLSDLRFESSFIKKSTKVSNTNAIRIVSGENAANGVNTVKVDKLAKTAYLTGGDLTTADGVMFTSKATLKQLGFSGEGSFDISGSGITVKIDINEDMTLDDVVNKFKKVGLNASFDQDNQRFFISSANSGAINNFTLTANDSKGMEALAKLGLLSTFDPDSEEYKGYTTWAGYATDAAAYQKVLDAEMARRAAAYKAANDQLTADNEQIRKNNITNQENLEKLEGYDPSETRDSLKRSLYGYEVTQNKLDADGNPIPKLDADGNEMKDADGNTIYETETVTKYDTDSIGGDLKAAKEKLADLQKQLEEYNKEGSTATEEEIAAVEQEIIAATTDVEAKQKTFDEAETRYAFLDGIETNKKLIEENEATIADNQTYYAEDADGNITATQKLSDDVKAEYDEKVANAVKVMNGDYKDLATATKVDGCDAEITMNGAKFTSMSNTFTINGLTFDALETTTNEVTITTTEDTDGIYNMIKNFFSEYNKLINEMDSLYNADAAKGYDPLLSEEKKELSDSEVEEWEKKIKDSLLRKDSTLSTVSDAMKTILMQGVEVNGKQMYLSDFGINTLGYFTAPENERNAYHIDGDADDSSTSKETDVLKAMIAADPNTVTAFFTKLSNKLYNSLTEKMSATTMSSAFTVYNDKQMKSDYESYTEKISKQEEKLNDLIDSWYKKFSAMETALAKLESKNSAISGMFGG
mgnify:FL=1